MAYVLVNSEDTTADSQDAGGSGEETGPLSEAQITLNSFWPTILDEIKRIKNVDAKNQVLPLARIKKIMKLDEDVKMISAEAPLLFAKAAEIFIHELTLRAWVFTEENKRRTLQRSDIAMAISKYDQFDFLIDIVPREEIKTMKKETETKQSTNCEQVNQVQYYLQLAQQHQQALQGSSTTNLTQTSQPQIQVQTTTGTPVTLNTGQNILVTTPTSNQQTTGTMMTGTLMNNVHQQPNQQQIQVVQQIITPTGEITHIPIPLSPSQLNLIRMQSGGNQPIIIQTGPQVQTQPHILQLSQTGQPGTAGVFLNTTQTTSDE